MQSISVPLQYLIAAALEVTDVTLFKPSGFTMGMNNWNIAQMRIFWQYSAIVRQEPYNQIISTPFTNLL